MKMLQISCDDLLEIQDNKLKILIEIFSSFFGYENFKIEQERILSDQSFSFHVKLASGKVDNPLVE